MLELSDIQDEILMVTVDDLTEAHQYVISIAKRHGVPEERLKDPYEYNIKQLAVNYACMRRAKLTIGKDPISEMDTNTEDIYKVKYKIYLTELNDILKNLTEEDFTGASSPGGGSVIIEVFRA